MFAHLHFNSSHFAVDMHSKVFGKCAYINFNGPLSKWVEKSWIEEKQIKGKLHKQVNKMKLAKHTPSELKIFINMHKRQTAEGEIGGEEKKNNLSCDVSLERDRILNKENK